MMPNIILISYFFLLSGLLTLPIVATGANDRIQTINDGSLTSILTNALDAFLTQNQAGEHGAVEFEVGHIDSRLRLKECMTDIEAQPTQLNWLRKHSSFRFKCAKPTWAITLPIKFKKFKKTWHTKHHISQNQLITASDVFLKEIDILSSHFNFMPEKQSLKGMIAKRSIPRNAPIFSHSVKRSKTIKKNEKVDILAISQSFQVRSKGVALEDGFAGESIKVRNTNSKRIVEARIKSAGLVEIRL